MHCSGHRNRVQTQESITDLIYQNKHKQRVWSKTTTGWVEVNSGSFPNTSEKGTQVRNTCNYRMDGERRDMPGKEELPILHLDATVYCPLTRRHFLVFFIPLTSSFFLVHALLFYCSFLLSVFSWSSFIPSFWARPYLSCCQSFVACVKCLAGQRRTVCDGCESTLECRGAFNHVLPWPLNKLIFYGCTPLPCRFLLKGLHPIPSAFDPVIIRNGFKSLAHMRLWEYTVVWIVTIWAPHFFLCSWAEETINWRMRRDTEKSEQVNADVSLTAEKTNERWWIMNKSKHSGTRHNMSWTALFTTLVSKIVCAWNKRIMFKWIQPELRV